jgi:hypothetical protein
MVILNRVCVMVGTLSTSAVQVVSACLRQSSRSPFSPSERGRRWPTGRMRGLFAVSVVWKSLTASPLHPFGCRGYMTEPFCQHHEPSEWIICLAHLRPGHVFASSPATGTSCHRRPPVAVRALLVESPQVPASRRLPDAVPQVAKSSAGRPWRRDPRWSRDFPEAVRWHADHADPPETSGLRPCVPAAHRSWRSIPRDVE